MHDILRIENLSKSFYIHHLRQRIEATKNISLHVSEGEFIGITGKSGSGKSTILKSIYRTYLPEEGRIYYHSKAYGVVDLTKAHLRQIIYLRSYEIGYVSQFLRVMPRTTAREIMERALLEMGVPRDEAQREAVRMFEHFGIEKELWDNYPMTFSGGEKLRLNVASAMIKKPRLLLLDEPTASLDQESKGRVRSLIEQLKNHGTTMIGIFHDLEFMKGLCDKEFRMETSSYV
mgnify:CR=1 FL=1